MSRGKMHDNVHPPGPGQQSILCCQSAYQCPVQTPHGLPSAQGGLLGWKRTHASTKDAESEKEPHSF